MKAMDIFDAIGMIDEESLENVKKTPNSSKSLWIIIASLAACFGLIFLIPKLKNFNLHDMLESEDYKESLVLYSSVVAETSIAEQDVRIYYVDGDKISCVKEFLPCMPEDIFKVWKEKNGIGEEVKFIEYKIDSNATSYTFEFQGNEYMKYNVGDYFILNLTLSENLEEYYDRMNSELLLQSLQQTMTEYSSIEYDEYYLHFE